MQIPGALSRLRETLHSILDATPTRESVGELVRQFHVYATVYLKSQVQRGRIHPHHINLSLSDIAVDCIAPLFKRDESGRFPEIHRYYSRLNWRDCSAEELSAQTRRLVCSAVHQGVRHIWRDNDHSLANILRNLKAGVQKSETLHIVEEGGEAWVACENGTCQDLPVMSQEYLEAHISPFVASEPTIPRILDRISEFLLEEDQHRRRVPLMMLALAIRYAAVRAGAMDEDVREPWDSLSQHEIRRYIDESVARIYRSMLPAYVGSGKVESEFFCAYLEAVRRLLVSRYVDSDGEKVTLHSLLAGGIPDLTKDVYRESHRNRLEYLYHSAEKDLLKSLKKTLS